MDDQDNQKTSSRIFNYHANLPCFSDEFKDNLYLPPTNIIHSDTGTGVSNLMVYFPSLHPPYISRLTEVLENTIILAIDGARKNTGTPVVSFGVWFGTKSLYNANGLLPTDLPQTCQSAELYAVKTGLQVVCDKIYTSSEHKDLNQIVIMTESKYIKDCMSKDTWKWEKNGYMTARKTSVANSEAVKAMHGLIKGLEEKNIAVQFWLIDRKYNEAAKQLAQDALGVEGEIQEVKKKKKPKKNQGCASALDDSDSKECFSDPDFKNLALNGSVLKGSAINGHAVVKSAMNGAAINGSSGMKR
jgi:ribonuclease HI